MRGKFTERCRDERGVVVTVWALVTITLMTVLIGVAVDLTGQLATLRQASDIAGQAARTAAQQVSTDTYMADGHSVTVTAGRAKNAALGYIRGAGMTGTARIVDGNLVVKATSQYQTRFLSIIGIPSITVTGSTATVRIARALNGEEHP